MYPVGEVVMNTWNEHVQFQMLLDALYFSKNSLVGLPREFINISKTETVVIASIANGLATTATDLLKQDLTNFLLAIPFEADSTHMESVTRTGMMSLG
jgi:hypothetical protein